MKTFLTTTYNGEAAGDWAGMHAEAAKHKMARVSIEVYTEARDLSERQRAWWKGVLIPALTEDGNSKIWWENTLKMAVLPEDFQPILTTVGGIPFAHLPSITSLSCNKMNMLIEGSVAHLRDECDKQWVTLPDPELRRK